MTILEIKKYKDENLKQWLIGTGNETLIEGNWWHDNFWGACSCPKCEKKRKHNNLGKILMYVREGLILEELEKTKDERLHFSTVR